MFASLLSAIRPASESPTVGFGPTTAAFVSKAKDFSTATDGVWRLIGSWFFFRAFSTVPFNKLPALKGKNDLTGSNQNQWHTPQRAIAVDPAANVPDDAAEPALELMRMGIALDHDGGAWPDRSSNYSDASIASEFFTGDCVWVRGAEIHPLTFGN